MATCLIRWAWLQPPQLGQVFVIHHNTFQLLICWAKTQDDLTAPRGTKRVRSPTTPSDSPKAPPSLNDLWTEHMSMSSGLAEFADLRYYEPGTTLGFVLDDYARYKAAIGVPPAHTPAAPPTEPKPELPEPQGAQKPRAPEPGSTAAAASPDKPRGTDHDSTNAIGKAPVAAVPPRSHVPDVGDPDPEPAHLSPAPPRNAPNDDDMDVDPQPPPGPAPMELRESTLGELEEDDAAQGRRREAIIRAWLADQARLAEQLRAEQGAARPQDLSAHGGTRTTAMGTMREAGSAKPPTGYVLVEPQPDPNSNAPHSSGSHAARVAVREGKQPARAPLAPTAPAPTPAGKMWAERATRAPEPAGTWKPGQEDRDSPDVLVSEGRGFEELLGGQPEDVAAPQPSAGAPEARRGRSPAATSYTAPVGPVERRLPPNQETRPWATTYWTRIDKHIPIERDDPLAMFFGMDKERVKKWTGYDRSTTLFIEPFNSAVPNKEKADAMALLIADVLREVAGLPDTPDVLSPKLAKPRLEATGGRNHPRAAGDRVPTVWCAKGLPEDTVRFLLGDRARSPYFSTPRLTFRALPLTQRFPTFLFALGGHGRTVLAEVRDTVKAAFFTEEFYNATAPYLAEAAALCGKALEDEVTRIAQTGRVTVFRLPSSGAIIANVYCLSPTSDIAQWREWRRAVSLIDFGDDDEGLKPHICPPVLCGGCQAADHAFSQCPFPELNGWNRPRPPAKRKEGRMQGGTQGRSRDWTERNPGRDSRAGYDNQFRAAGPSSSYDRRDWSQRGGNRPQTRGKDWVGPKRYDNADEDGTPFRGGDENEFAYGGF
ncbi:hypothetical protein C8Q76DRAFT_689722 [Earliella scabrosa]|nr:hypothetical protein C8Q76DRAFT_689722 [Earliella scabrosa]